MDLSLEKIDLLRERTGLSYTSARRLLEETDGDVVAALVLLEEEEQEEGGQFRRLASNILEPAKKLLRQGNRTRIKIKTKERTLLEIPATLGLAAALLVPKLTALGTAALLMTSYSLELQHPDEPEASGTDVCGSPDA